MAPLRIKIVPKLVAEARDDRLAGLLIRGATLVGETRIRSELQANGDVVLTTTSLSDVPEEFKGGKSLWDFGWMGGEPQ